MNEWKFSKLEDITWVTDFSANGSFADLRDNVEYLTDPDYAILVRLIDFSRSWKGDYIYISKHSYEFLKTCQLEEGDVIIANIGANAGTLFRVPFLGKPAALGPNALVIKVHDYQKISRGYIYYYFSSNRGQKQIQNIISVTAQPKFNKTDLRNLLIPLPDYQEQQAIAEALRDTDKLIEKLERLLAKKRQVKQGAMQELLKGRRRLPGFMKKSGNKHTEIGIIPEDWIIHSLGSFTEIVAGGDLNKDDFSPRQDDQYQYPIYSNALTNNGLYGYSQSYKFEPNKITVTARGDIGHAKYRDSRFTAIGRLLIVSIKGNYDLRFVSEYINNYVNFALESTGVPQLTAPQISKYIIAMPSTKAEQTSIADIISDMDTEIKLVEEQLEKAQQIKQGMMQELLTGRIRLV